MSLLLTLGLPIQASASTSGAEAGISQPTSTSLGVNIAYGEPGQAIGFGTNPFINCSFVWSLTGNQALEYGGARGQLENGFDVVCQCWGCRSDSS